MGSDPEHAPILPEGRAVDLPGRGVTFVRELPGPPGAPTLVLLHGWTATAALNWRDCFAPLASEFRVVAPDHRGHGRGIRSRGPFRLEDCADDVAALADALGIERCIPVGYSMGGPVAALVWRRHPALVEGLVLCATAARFIPLGARQVALTSGVLGLAWAVTASPGGLLRAAHDRFVSSRVAASPFGEWVASEIGPSDPASLIQAGAALRRFDAGPWLDAIDVPTAVIVTNADNVVAPFRQRRLAAGISGARSYDVEGDHAVCTTDPDRFVPILASACREVSGRAAAHPRARR